jgi:hypothetical protein
MSGGDSQARQADFGLRFRQSDPVKQMRFTVMAGYFSVMIQTPSHFSGGSALSCRDFLI